MNYFLLGVLSSAYAWFGYNYITSMIIMTKMEAKIGMIITGSIFWPIIFIGQLAIKLGSW
jgi:hypothetical protein